jgi:hypothetical protein
MASTISTKGSSDAVPIDQPGHVGAHRPSVNITAIERVGRIAMGAGAAIIGVVLLTSASTVWAIALEVLLIVAGLDLVVTGAIGHCPLYQRLGHVPASLRRSR